MDEGPSDASACAGASTHLTRSPLARYGQWLILVWAPLLLGAYVLAAASDHQWRDLTLLLAACAAFVLSIVNFYRPRSIRRFTVPAWLPLLVLAAVVVMILSTTRTVASSELAFVSVALLVITAAVVLPPRIVPAVIVAVAVCGAVAGLLAGWGWGLVSWLTVTTVLSGMGTFLVHQLAATIRELDRTRRQLAEAAVSAERVRFSRDLHDLLGHTLSVIVVKAEAVRRLAEADPAAAAAHGAEIEALGRSALTEVRQAVAGYREGGLEDEVSRAAAALRAGGIRPVIGHVPPGLDPGAERQLAWVVREATTNVLRHSGASTCRVLVDRPAGGARVTVADDGHGTPGGLANGTGLVGLRERLAGRGGTVTVEHGPDGFTLVAEVPLTTGDTHESVSDGRGSW
ncbi:sensor histidine kinase [Ornithinicoccus hortensis]|uniref:Two-component system sensor histidine kinase DesK n=1 Tax=Ornithinicoccus hortensis TaxID=82346 RepID=A0A542YU92_9MICO|nr:histidine kinase [Ornithinicoccus hortensis]TQL51659.1 two-component system sensor histidine kinase DesK [Ornithinicoccus hortensis]